MNFLSGERFPKCNRVLKRTDYLDVQRNGVKVHSRAFLGLIKPSESGRVRLGIVTTKRMGNAVTRNRTRRLVREAFRRGWMSLPNCIDVVVIAKKSAAEMDSKSVFNDLAALSRRVTRIMEKNL